jgi:multidrug efflux system outer membrane protein
MTLRGGQIGATAVLALLAGCTLGGRYERPPIDTPPAYRGADDAPATSEAAGSLGDELWSSVFHDPVLEALIRSALEQNLNVRIAANRVLQERAQLTITRADEFPTVNATAERLGVSSPALGAFPSYAYQAEEVTGSVSWTLDFWGRYRKATEAARANLAASEWGQRAARSTLVADVASDYFQLQALDVELDISRRTAKSRRESLELITTLANGGADSLADVRQAEQLVYTAEAAIPDLERQIQQQENALRILLGQNPGPIPRGPSLIDEALPEAVPPGLTSNLLERRPDVREAEENLVAANAQVGVARAELFPTISLTGMGGFESTSLSNLFTGASHAWSYSGSLTQPIFEAGKLRANLRLAKAEREQLILSYRQTIQQAFSDVSNALIGYRKYREYAAQEAKLVTAAEDAVRLANLRYQAGATSFLEVLTNDANAYSAELDLVQARLGQRLALVQLYSALGGGWQPDEGPGLRPTAEAGNDVRR